MTRLKEDDIAAISRSLSHYDDHLQKQTGKRLLALAAHSCGVAEKVIKNRICDFSLHVVPVTAGQGIIGGFSQTVCTILQFLGFQAKVASTCDAAGVAEAYESGKDGIFFSDDHRFVGINLKTGTVADNSFLTGAAYATALDGMAAGLTGKEVLVIGCGPVGEHAAKKLLSLEADVYLFDTNISSAKAVLQKLQSTRVKVLEQLPQDRRFTNILEATPSVDSIPDHILSRTTKVAAAGVPLGISEQGCSIINNALVHDKLELGVAAMAISLLSPYEKGDNNG